MFLTILSVFFLCLESEEYATHEGKIGDNFYIIREVKVSLIVIALLVWLNSKLVGFRLI